MSTFPLCAGVFVWLNFVYSASTIMSLPVQLPWCTQKTLFLYSLQPLLTLTIFPPPHSQWSPSLREISSSYFFETVSFNKTKSHQFRHTDKPPNSRESPVSYPQPMLELWYVSAKLSFYLGSRDPKWGSHTLPTLPTKPYT